MVDSCSLLEKVNLNSFDLLVSNYVLMDTPELNASLSAFNKVLKMNGSAIIIFSHPCFPQSRAIINGQNNIVYDWNFSYFEESKQISPPWAHFKDDFVWFHRSLSTYWKEFIKTGFRVVEFEEPRISPDRYHMTEDDKLLHDFKNRPYSVAFKLEKVKQL